MTKEAFLVLHAKVGWERIRDARAHQLKFAELSGINSNLCRAAVEEWTVNFKKYRRLSPEEVETELRGKGGAA